MNKYLFILLSSLFVSNIFAGNKDELHCETMRPTIFATKRLGQVGLAHNGKDFAVIKDGKFHLIKPYLVDKTLRNRSSEQIAKYMAHHSVEIKQGCDQEFSLEAHNRQLGGGPIGTTVGATIGKTGTYVVCHGAIKGIAAVASFFGTPGAGVAVDLALTTNLALPIEALSNKMAIVGGIWLGVASGPF